MQLWKKKKKRINKKQKRNKQKSTSSPSLQSDLGIIKNYERITVTDVAVKTYNTMLLNRILTEVLKSNLKSKTNFGENNLQFLRF